MGKVLIIKNNDVNSGIHTFACDSFREQKKRVYNTMDGSANELHLQKIENDFEGNGIILLISYKSSDTQNIQDIFIGTDVNIIENHNIEYVMRVHLTKEENERTIESIIDKIDLDVTKDFEPGCYIMLSSMESFYEEMKERILVKEQIDYMPNNDVVETEPEIYELSQLAQKDEQAKRIYKSDKVDRYRTEFQRDRERVVNCKAFRRMVDKAQIFSAEKGDYYRTRMTHSLEVNQIAKAIAYALKLNLDLTEAIALGHDIGHTPFGHQGERTLDNILSGKEKIGIEGGTDIDLLQKRCFGGFKHNYQSAKILAQIEEKYYAHPGLNVSVQVIEGVLKHTKIKPNDVKLKDFLSEKYLNEIEVDYESEEQVCSSLEGQVVAIADEIAQRGHDVDDALTSGVMTIKEFKDMLEVDKCQELAAKINSELEKVMQTERHITDKKDLQIARIVSCIVNYFIVNTVKHSERRMLEHNDLSQITMKNTIKIVEFSPEVQKVNAYLERVVQKKVICNNEVARADYNANQVVKKLFEKYYFNPRLLHSGTINKIFIETLRHTNKAVSNSAINISDGSIELVNKEIFDMTRKVIDKNMIAKYLQGENEDACEEDIIIFEKRKILVRAITDYIAGMTDGYALEEFEKLK
ncbi:MAG: dNTP triphosphohydrolase [Lachnospiraceae bacterium]|nr:dNTP triphosphohydrolase [Lachnospiraceae bacterium]